MPSSRLRLVVYAPQQRVDWSTHWQETKSAELALKIPMIVKAIERASIELAEKIKDAERRWKMEQPRWHAEQAKRAQDEDRLQVQQSVKDSQTQLDQIIQAWTEGVNVDRFLQGVEECASELPSDRRETILRRLRLAREFVGKRNPLEFFLAWKTPGERYQPLSLDAFALKGIDVSDE